MVIAVTPVLQDSSSSGFVFGEIKIMGEFDWSLVYQIGQSQTLHVRHQLHNISAFFGQGAFFKLQFLASIVLKYR